MSLHVFSVTCSTKILTLAISPVLFISVRSLCEFAIPPDVYILLSSREKEVPHAGQMYTFSSTFIKKIEPFSVVPKVFKHTSKYMPCVLEWNLRALTLVGSLAIRFFHDIIEGYRHHTHPNPPPPNFQILAPPPPAP